MSFETLLFANPALKVWYRDKLIWTILLQDFTTKEMQVIISQVEVQLTSEKLKKMTADEETRLEKAKLEVEVEEKRLNDIMLAEQAEKEAQEKAAEEARAAAEAAGEGEPEAA